MLHELAARVGVATRVTEQAVSVHNAALASGTRCVSVDHKSPVTAPTLDALHRVGVRYLSTRSIGCNHIDVEHAGRVGICVGNVAYSPDSVADYTLMLMLMAVRNARSIITRAARHDYRLNTAPGKELRDLTVGVIGTGRIGTAVIERLRGFGGRILAYDTRPTPALDHVGLEELLQHSDIVTLHAPLTADTHHLLDRARIARMKRGAWVINTARGALVDGDALVQGLEDGRLGGAALDVVEGEEEVFYRDLCHAPPESSTLARLRALPQVLISPHTAYYTDHALKDMVEASLANCLDFQSSQRHE